MKKTLTLAGAMVASTLSLQSALVYSTDFNVTQLGATGAVVLGGGATADVTAANWFGSTNAVGCYGGDLTLGNTSNNRFRGVGVWLDTSTWGAAGLVTVEFDVANFTAGDDSTAVFEVYAANGVDASNFVSLDLHGNFSGGSVSAQTGTSSIRRIAQETIVGDGVDTQFTFAYNGTDQYIALVFANSNAGSTGTGNTVDIDNLSVNTVPEPASAALLGLGGLTLILDQHK